MSGPTGRSTSRWKSSAPTLRQNGARGASVSGDAMIGTFMQGRQVFPTVEPQDQMSAAQEVLSPGAA